MSGIKSSVKTLPTANQTGGTLKAVPNNRTWERRPKESVPAYDAFQIYITCKEERLGGVSEVARRVGKNRSLVSKWCQRHDWVERYRAYENNQIFRVEQAQQTELQQHAKLWAGRRIDVREEGFTAGAALLKRARLLLDLPVFEKEVRATAIGQDGQEIETVTILNFLQHPRDARLFAETGLKLMRLSADMSTENMGIINSDVDFETMTDEELDLYAENLLKIKQQAVAGVDI